MTDDKMEELLKEFRRRIYTRINLLVNRIDTVEHIINEEIVHDLKMNVDVASKKFAELNTEMNHITANIKNLLAIPSQVESYCANITTMFKKLNILSIELEVRVRKLEIQNDK